MTFTEYQRKAKKTAIYPQNQTIIYPSLGLAGEVGEVCEKVKKVIRDHGGFFSPMYNEEIAKELGDVFWYLSALASDLGFNLDDIAKMNIDKLKDRQKRGKIQGSGDNR
jgi:NTP pyrophosphatase (non-canonical NTP hydrolase)